MSQIRPVLNHYEVYHRQSPMIVWLCGYRSDISGNKVQVLKSWASEHDYGFLCFDYSGHGQSPGKLSDGTIGQWIEEAYALISAHCHGNILLVGSSMGAWIALRIAQRLQSEHECAVRIKAMVLLAPAPDFTEDLIWNQLNTEEHIQFEQTGLLQRPSRYSDEMDAFSLSFIEEGRNHLIFSQPYQVTCPIHILHGTNDDDVPLAHGLKLMQHLGEHNVQLTLIAGGDHRLSRPQDMQVMLEALKLHLQ